MTGRSPKEEGQATVGASVGQALKERRTGSGVSIRQLADQVGVSPSLVSQIENNKVNPSVGTLVSLVTALGLSLDELFLDGDDSRPADGAAGVLRGSKRQSLDLATGVHWSRLTPTHEEGIDFLHVVYDVGGASCPPDALMRHLGREYGLILSGRLGATVGFETYELEAGDSIVFNSEVPHRLWTIGEEPVTAVWTIIGRNGDERAESLPG